MAEGADQVMCLLGCCQGLADSALLGEDDVGAGSADHQGAHCGVDGGADTAGLGQLEAAEVQDSNDRGLSMAVGINGDKRGFFPNEKRIEIIEQATAGLEGVTIIQYSGLTIDKCREMGVKHIVRGVRNMIDFETERSIADANRKLAPEIETIIIPTAQEYAHISSTAVRDILRHGGDTSLFVAEGVTL